MMGDAIGPIAIQAEFRDGKSSSPVRNTVKRPSERGGTNFAFLGNIEDRGGPAEIDVEARQRGREAGHGGECHREEGRHICLSDGRTGPGRQQRRHHTATRHSDRAYLQQGSPRYANVKRGAGQTGAPPTSQRTGGAYCRPPLVQRPFWPRAIFSSEPWPTLRSKDSP